MELKGLREKNKEYDAAQQKSSEEQVMTTWSMFTFKTIDNPDQMMLTFQSWDTNFKYLGFDLFF